MGSFRKLTQNDDNKSCTTPSPLDPKVLTIHSMAVVGIMLSAALLLAIICAYLVLHYYRRNQSRRRTLPLFLGTQDDFLDENREPQLDNPVWYISTVGLQQSVIDSITVFKYKKDEGLIEGTECSVCLNEFQEDESLRLLPKCSHAFHLPCIDTWLKSHKNCPLCRAPIVSENMVAGAQATESEPHTIDSGSRNEALVEISNNPGVGVGRNDVGEDGSGTSEMRTCPIEDGNTSGSGNSKRSTVHSKRTSSSVSSSQDNVEPMRRSVSLDSPSASEIYRHVAGLANATHKHRGSLDSELQQQLKCPKGKKSSSICKLIKSSSNGRSLSKGPISMKKSLSSGGKFLSSKQSKSRVINSY